MLLLKVIILFFISATGIHDLTGEFHVQIEHLEYLQRQGSDKYQNFLLGAK